MPQAKPFLLALGGVVPAFEPEESGLRRERVVQQPTN